MLLPFGTIAPGLLLPLLAFAYMLFFGSFVLPKKTADEQTEKRVVSTFIEPGEALLNGAAPFFSNSIDDSTDTCLENTDNWLFAGWQICLVIKIPTEDIISDTHLHPCFARPPPAATMA